MNNLVVALRRPPSITSLNLVPRVWFNGEQFIPLSVTLIALCVLGRDLIRKIKMRGVISL